LIPPRGAGYPETPAIATRGELFVIGPMARSAADLALALSVLAGPDEMWDGIGYKLALPEPRHDKLTEYRVLVIDAHPLCPTAVSIKEALDRLTDRLAKSGCTIVRSSPKMPDLARTTRDYSELLLALLSADLAPDERARIEAAANALSPDDQSSTAARLRGSTMSHAAWVRTNRIGSGLRARWQALFQDVDVILCPPMPTTAFPHDHSPPRTRQLDVDGGKIPYYDQLAWAAVATLTGLPATVVPIGRDASGLPIGAQIIGGYLNDRTTIAFAVIEREFGEFTPPPNF
jgi:amidase